MKPSVGTNINTIAQCVAFCCMYLVGANSLADDIDIYGTTGGTGLSPNVMFLLSTSSSMSCGVGVPYTSDCAYTRHEEQKITILQGVLKNLISELSGDVSVGLSRFTHPGGSILYPAKPLGSDVGGGANGYVYSSTYPVIHPHDDAWINKGSGVITVDDALSARGVNTTDVIAWSDTPYVNIADTNVTLGLRIDNVMIPRDAVITEAHLVFHGAKQADVSSDNNNDNISVGTAGVDVRVLKGDPGRFTTSSAGAFATDMGNILEGPASIGGLEQFSYGDFHQLDVTSLVDSKVESANGWCAGSAITFLLSGTGGSRHVHTNELAISAAPRLVVKYQKGNTAPSPCSDGEVVTSVRNKLIELIELLPSNGQLPMGGAMLEVGNYFRSGPVEYGAGIGFEVGPESEMNAQAGVFTGPRLGYMQTTQLSHPVSFANADQTQLGSLLNDECLYTSGRSRECVSNRFYGVGGLPNRNELSSLGSDLSYSGPPVSSSAICIGENHLVLISDEFPGANVFQAPVTSSAVTRDLSDLYNSLRSTSGSCATADPWDCTLKIATELKSPSGTADPIEIHVIGFALREDANPFDLANLVAIASTPSHHHLANDEMELATELEGIIDTAEVGAETVTIPSVSVNQVSSLQHLDQLYYSMFRPSTSTNWLGNVKRFRLDGSSATVVGVNGEDAFIEAPVTTIDNLGNLTTREVTQFNPEATSWWNQSGDEPDGGDIERGGLGNRLAGTSAGTQAYSLLGGYETPAVGTWVYIPRESELTNAENELDNANAEAVKAVLDLSDVSTQAEANAIIDWARSADNMGAPVHSQAQLATYSWVDDTSSGVANGVVDSDELYNSLFVSTIRGFLHGFDISDDNDNATTRELFRFIPPELLKNLPALKRGETGSLAYGLDSTWTVFRHDAWKLGADGVFRKDDVIDAVNPGAPSYPNDDFVYIYAGMRRGGNNYYALDVSSVNGKLATTAIKPAFRFALLGGDTQPAGSPYYHMGQTWSQPELGQINVLDASGAVTRTPVIIFAGGYDEKYDLDADQTGTDEDEGNAIYIADAMTGRLIWWASSRNWSRPSGDTVGYRIHADMKYSIPSKIKVLDTNSDGLTDRLYVGDVAGQVFRIDLKNGKNPGADSSATTEPFGQVTLLAQLGRTSTAGADNNRRFFEPPSVSFSSCGTVNVALVSGDRARPFSSETSDHLFVIHDSIGAASTTAVNSGDLVTVTLAASGLVSGSVSNTDAGWQMAFNETGERSFGSPFVFNSNVFFTSYIPPAQAPARWACVVDTGVSRLYALSLACSSIGQGTTIFSNNDNQLTAFQEVGQGPSTTPTVVVGEVDGIPKFILLPSSEAIDSPEELMKKTNWRSLDAP